MGIIRHSSSRKIDVDDLRMLLSDSMKGGNHASVGSEGLEGGATRLREITGARKGNTRSRSRSKGASFDGYKTAGSAATVKMDDASALPAWYKTLKKNITSWKCWNMHQNEGKPNFFNEAYELILKGKNGAIYVQNQVL